MAQRRASTMLDFPQPLGPTMAVIPELSSITVFSTNDLNPTISRLFKRITSILLRQFCEGKSQAQAFRQYFTRRRGVSSGNYNMRGDFLIRTTICGDDLQSKILFLKLSVSIRDIHFILKRDPILCSGQA